MKAEATLSKQSLIAIQQLTKARQAAGHTEESGEVCTPDCEGCNDPVGQLVRDLQQARRTATSPTTPSAAAMRAAREWMNTYHAAFKTNKEREDALAAIVTRNLAGTSVFHAVLHELSALHEAQDEPDFMHSITEYAHGLAGDIINNAYARSSVASVPAPAVAPDGDGGVVVQWRSGEREVRLVAAASKDHKSYIYSRGIEPAKVDCEMSGAVLAEILRSTFAAATTSPETPEPHCWHCGTILEAVELKLRCDQCPADCDDETCSAFGCAPNGGASTAPVPAAGDDEGDYQAGVLDACKAICECCANAEKWGEAARVQGSMRFWHGDYPCNATPIRTTLAAALRSGEGEGK